ncbi:MAG TPA: hypothetical protein VKS78_15455 [Roseiarcus sp.]|nr:hypothetical protein [Roseiarcus sp.]
MTKGKAKAKEATTSLASLRRPLAAWFAALALIFQLVAGAAHAPQGASPADLTAAALSAAIGHEVSLCGDGARGQERRPFSSETTSAS